MSREASSRKGPGRGSWAQAEEKLPEMKKGAFAPFFSFVAGPTRFELASSGVTGRRYHLA